MVQDARVCAPHNRQVCRRAYSAFLLILIFLVAQHSSAQDVSPAASNAETAPQEPTPVLLAAPHAPAARDISWKAFGPNTLRDQRDIWLFPYAAIRGRHLKPVLAVTAVALGLVLADAPSARYFRHAHSYAGFDHAFSGENTWLATESVPAALYLAGLVGRDKYAQRTALLSAEAFLDSEVVSLVMEDATHRLLPSEVRPGGNFSDTWFAQRHGNYMTGAGGFPSGHTIAAFSIATIIANRYPNRRWHRWLAYGLASAVGFSRLSGGAHFPSDVFVGAVLGYSIARDVVLRPSPSARDLP